MLTAALQAVVDTLGTVVDVRTAKRHPGIFDARELARVSIRAPAILLTLSQLDPAGMEDGECLLYDASLRLWCVARDKLGSPRLDGVIDDLIAPLLGSISDGRQWGAPAVWDGVPTQPSAGSLYNTTIDKQGLALWVIDWSQQCRIGRTIIA